MYTAAVLYVKVTSVRAQSARRGARIRYPPEMPMLRLTCLAAASCALALACGGDDDGMSVDGGGGSDGGGGVDAPATDAPATDAPTTDAPAADAPATDAPPTDAPAVDGGPATCSMGTSTPIGQLCVTEATDASATFVVYPMGCFSSSCTIQHTTTCSVSRSGSALSLDALFCLADTGGPVCTDDCGGGGSATCDIDLEAGNYTATLGGLSVTFDAPSTIPLGGICDGSPF
jgi:hypothetical protein